MGASDYLRGSAVLDRPNDEGSVGVHPPGLKRDYIRVNPIPDAALALAAIAEWMDDYNEIRPHSRRLPLTASWRAYIHFSKRAIWRTGLTSLFSENPAFVLLRTTSSAQSKLAVRVER